MLFLEFQSNLDQLMGVRKLTYTGLLYQRLVDEGVLRKHSGLPSVLPVVIYNGQGRLGSPDGRGRPGRGRRCGPAPYHSSQRYFVLDEARTRPGDLPTGKPRLGAGRAGDDARTGAARAAALELIDLLRGEEGDEPRRALSTWTRQALMPAPFRPTEMEPLAQLADRLKIRFG